MTIVMQAALTAAVITRNSVVISTTVGTVNCAGGLLEGVVAMVAVLFRAARVFCEELEGNVLIGRVVVGTAWFGGVAVGRVCVGVLEGNVLIGRVVVGTAVVVE